MNHATATPHCNAYTATQHDCRTAYEGQFLEGAGLGNAEARRARGVLVLVDQWRAGELVERIRHRGHVQHVRGFRWLRTVSGRIEHHTSSSSSYHCIIFLIILLVEALASKCSPNHALHDDDDDDDEEEEDDNDDNDDDDDDDDARTREPAFLSSSFLSSFFSSFFFSSFGGIWKLQSDMNLPHNMNHRHPSTV